jgi:DNA-binding CsgD family transcriptional regulator/tetratricopeptide (TPR) repeat protein
LVGEEDSPLRARVQASLALALALTGREDEAKQIGDEALAAARRHGDAEVLMGALQCACIYEPDARTYLDLSVELCDLATSLGDTWVYCYARGGAVRAFLILGRVAEAKAFLPGLHQASERGRYVVYRFQAMVFDAIFALLDGRLAEAERLAEAASEFGAAARTEFDAGVYGVQMYAIRREQGRLDEVAPTMRLAAALQRDEPVWRPGLAALFADVGMFTDARREFDLMAPDGFAAVARDATWPGSLTDLAEVCRALGDVEQAKVLYAELARFHGLTMQVGFTVNLGPAERLMGNLAAIMGRRTDAERHFAAALAMAVAAESPLWIARTKFDWAVSLGDRPDLLADARAMAHQFELGDLVKRIAAVGSASMPSLDLTPPTDATPPSSANRIAFPDGLSGREVEVLRLVATGRSNREIGDQLYISMNTVANHVRSILQKTGAANRAEATAYAARHGLLA